MRQQADIRKRVKTERSTRRLAEEFCHCSYANAERCTEDEISPTDRVWQCERCNEWCCWCNGSADNELCDECWADEDDARAIAALETGPGLQPEPTAQLTVLIDIQHEDFV